VPDKGKKKEQGKKVETGRKERRGGKDCDEQYPKGVEKKKLQPSLPGKKNGKEKCTQRLNRLTFFEKQK